MTDAGSVFFDFEKLASWSDSSSLSFSQHAAMIKKSCRSLWSVCNAPAAHNHLRGEGMY